ncbi:MAG: hypothetical protein GOV15_00155, partial [Candidatus Diapherotrites archaeon]|nr:hypothetical protein [Candidatus Diapherotrites archaeon]
YASDGQGRKQAVTRTSVLREDVTPETFSNSIRGVWRKIRMTHPNFKKIDHLVVEPYYLEQ